MDIEELKKLVLPSFIVAVDVSNILEADDSGFVFDNGDTIITIPMTIESLQDYKNSGLLDKYMTRSTFGSYVSKRALQIDPELINHKAIYVDVENYDSAQELKYEYFKRLDEILT